MRSPSVVISRRFFLQCSAAVTALPVFAGDDPYAAAPQRNLSDADWKKKLSPAAYAVLRHGDTEAPNSSALVDLDRDGTYVCAGCDQALFHSDDKFAAGTGWPSFYKIIEGAVMTQPDHKEAHERTEYHCSRCLGHQGYLYADGPQPWGLRYSNNGVALKFIQT